MKGAYAFEVTGAPDGADKGLVVEQTRAFNAGFMPKDVRQLCVFVRDELGAIVGGVTGKTYWSCLEVEYLWVSESHRKGGLASGLLKEAELEAARRGCTFALLDTYSFQALGFYMKQGYEEFGRVGGFCGGYERIYLRKKLETAGGQG